MRSRLRLLGLSILALAISCREGRPPDFLDNDDSGPAVRGGTLRVVGLSDVDHLLSSAAYSTTSIGLLTLFTRQLFAYPLSEDFKTAAQVAPDLAEELPTLENGGISHDNRTYTFHLRRGVMWNTKPPREVTAHDLVRGLKLICNPVNPSGAPGYYTMTIAGMKGHCDAFAKVPGTADDIRRFADSHEIEGVRTKDDFTVVINLIQPASDFLNILAMTFASAMPVEYMDYVPDSPEFRQHTISAGPYQIVKYTPNREIQLERNPVWSAATDPLRPAHPDRISIVLGIDQQLQQLQIAAGTADISFDQAPPTSEVAALLEIGDPKLLLSPPGDYYSGIWYLVVNRVGPNDGGPLAKPEVREALQYAINKAAVVQVQGGPQVSRPARQAVASTVSGYRSGADMYATPMDKGDIEKARDLLRTAGLSGGLSLKLAYPQSGTYALIAQTIQANLRRINFDVQITSYPFGDYYGRLLNNPENARRGVWDLALVGWYPDWNGSNNGRSVIQPLFDGRTFGIASMDYGGYKSEEVNRAIDRALITPRYEDAEKFWAEAVGRVLKDSAIIPLYETKMVRYHSSRIRNCLLNMWSLNCDFTGLWLKDASSGGENP